MLAVAFAAVPRANAIEPESATVASSAQLDAKAVRAEAQRHFSVGIEISKSGRDWEAALSEFLESRKLFKTRSATRNAAIALRQLGRNIEAVRMYDALLAEFSQSMSAAQLEQCRTERTALLERLGQLVIEQAIPGTEFAIDGRVITDAPPILLEAGHHTLRMTKEGFETSERELTIVAGAKGVVDAQLSPLRGKGSLTVEEPSGEFDILIDSVMVGRTPWRGELATGEHSIWLVGDHRGTSPTSVEIKESGSLSFSPEIVILDSRVEFRPRPAEATIFIDGVHVGRGSWVGMLPNGRHRFEAIAPGFLPFRADVNLVANANTAIRPVLALPTFRTDPPMTDRARFYLEADAGMLLSSSLRGGVDSSCGCSRRSRPTGWRASAHIGYAPLEHWGVELEAGYLTISESSTRSLTALADQGASFESHDFKDALSLSGPFGAIAASARFFRRFPMLTRVAAGLAALRATPSNSGTFEGLYEDRMGNPIPAQGELSVREPSATLATPFISSELRWGYRVADRLTLDLGATAFLLFPSSSSRSGRVGSAVGASDAGFLGLPDETVARTFLSWSPSVGIRGDF